jgi:CBS domain-containing protein
VIVSDVMTTALVTGAPGDLVDQVLYEMKLSAIRHLPVIGEKGRLEGIVSDRDVLLSLGTSQSTTVHLRDIMTKRIETVRDDANVTEALETMLEHKIGCLPVVGTGGQLVGVVTETDFLRVAHDLLSD